MCVIFIVASFVVRVRPSMWIRACFLAGSKGKYGGTGINSTATCRSPGASYTWAANHWLDCLVGCAAAASMLGVSLFRGATPKKVKRTRKHVAYL